MTRRREFLKQSGAGFIAAAASAAPVRARGANDMVVVGAIGCGGRGTSVAGECAGRKGVEVAYVCDPDDRRARSAAKVIASATGKTPTAVSDLRRVLDDKAVDAVVVATPDHWHAPAAILACDAGKHVYVEKPCCHNIREGQLLVEGAARSGKVVQHGTQSRSSGFIRHAIGQLREGLIGDVLVAKAVNVQRRANIGHAKPTAPPAGVDYDTWLGPAPFVPFQANRFHYTWHWWYDF